uniref:FAD-binding domain-containing protein n=1 Tax=Ditylum brightwellii TaxID=49249 RepID=A0A7S2ENP3_9STRA|mmetsp:Transcript_36843/g.55082  ORF Transcript_36843/g.55082 Transcript_36843/m.55082 type:complete len:228 (+) Transcript_36843:1130-1813(+)
MGRTVNICTMPGHDIWDTNKLRNDDGGRSAKAYFQKAFPRFDWDDIVSVDEWELFASTEGSRFPHCQYSPSLYVSSKPRDHEGTTTDGAGVVLIGDALHAFPPDLGQGVNSAFCDAMVLGESFEEAASDAVSAASTAIDPPKSFVARALNSYQAKNGPETRALIELARCGVRLTNTTQYNPAVENDETGQKILDGKRASAVVPEQGNTRAVAEAGDSHDDGFSFEFP